MRRRGAGARLAATLVLGLALAAVACRVNRRSDDLACARDPDCASGEICDRGLCVAAPPPPDAPGPPDPDCDPDEDFCLFMCTADAPCGRVDCPPGFDCTVLCDDERACGQVDCGDAERCEVFCTAPEACGQVQCGTSECEVTCDGDGGPACGAIACAEACSCDVDCVDAFACGAMQCPLDTECTEDGEPGAACDSDNSLSCDRCF